MIVISCQHESTKRHGRDRKGNQHFRCLLCGATFVEAGSRPLGDMRISMKQSVSALGMLLDGMSIRATERLTGLHRDTICDLILVVGDNCRRLLDAKVKNVKATDVQLDEIWSFIGMKEKTRVAKGQSAEWGDCWTFIAIERETKLVLTFAIGQCLLKLFNASTRYVRIRPASVTSRAEPPSAVLGGRLRQIVVNSAHPTPCCSRIAAAAPLSFTATSRTAARPALGPGRIRKKGMP
jgi:transposase-like protein